MKNLKIIEQIKIALDNFFIITPNLEIPTAKIGSDNGIVTMSYNPKFLANAKFREGVFAHEALHYLQGHISALFNQNLIKEAKGYHFPKTNIDFIFTHKLINIVIDHNINIFLLKEMQFSDPNNVILHNSNGTALKGTDSQIFAVIIFHFEKAYNNEVSQNGKWVNPIEIPIFFNKEAFNDDEKISFDPPQDGQGGNINTENVNTDSVEISEEDGAEECSIEEVLTEIQENIQSLEDALKGVKAEIGSSKGSTNINFEIQEELELDLESVLIQGFEDVDLENKKTDVTHSRMGFFGKRKAHSSFINLLCDVSGSMVWNNDRMEMLGSTLASIGKSYKFSCFDNGITEDDILTVSSRDIEDEISTIGGGGTQLLPAVELYQKQELLNQYPTIIITDGELFGTDLEDSLEILNQSEQNFIFIVVNENKVLLNSLEKQLKENIITLHIK